LPWRVHERVRGRRPSQGKAEPYRVWLSEIMLQQTTVPTVIGYFDTFLSRWPDVHVLAAAPLDDVLHAWAGLGYYARARNLHRCAKVVSRDLAGRFPDTEEALQALPGIGPYTAAAIAAIAFGRPATVVDGNVERVMARLHAVMEPLPAAKRQIVALADALTPSSRPGDYAQAVMDLGATVCTPRAPSCDQCPWADACQARAQGIAASLPRKAPKKPRPLRYGIAFWAARKDGAVLLRRRPDKGLLGGMIELPGSDWRDGGWTDDAALGEAPCAASWRRLPGEVRHVFTHFELLLTVYVADVDGRRVSSDGFWSLPAGFSNHALPTMTKKLVRHVLASGDQSI